MSNEPLNFMSTSGSWEDTFIKPMRSELTSVGFKELLTPDQVNEAFTGAQGISFVMVNSVCGCAAGKARPAVRYALEKTGHKPNNLFTVFAGQEKEATAKAREYFLPYPPSSPSIALLKDGKLAYFMERHQIESRDALAIAQDLLAAMEKVSAQ